LFFPSEKTVQSFPVLQKVLVSNGTSVALGPDGVEIIFKSKDSKAPNLFKSSSSIIMLAADSSRVIPSISKLTPSQVAYHFLAGYQNGKFVPAYESGPMSLDPVVVAKELSSQLTKSNISSFLASVNVGRSI
jgi:ATP-dependent phosphoenolpyruvate carboxykinase